MNITSLEIAQATMDMFFCLFCLIIFVSIKANNPKQKSMRMFVRLFLIATVLFFGETLAYIFRGNLGLFNILVTRIANLMVFAMNIAMANTYGTSSITSTCSSYHISEIIAPINISKHDFVQFARFVRIVSLCPGGLSYECKTKTSSDPSSRMGWSLCGTESQWADCPAMV